MATFTLSPTPIYGGTFNRFSIGQWDMTELSPGKYLLVFMQINPHHLVAQVVTVTGGASSPAFGIDFGTMKWIEALGIITPDFSVIALSATKVVVYYSTSTSQAHFRVLNIDGGDNITEATRADITMSSNTLPSTHFYDKTKRIEMVKIDSSNFYFMHMVRITTTQNSGTGVFLSRFNVAADVVTKTSEDDLDTVIGGAGWEFSETLVGNGSSFDLTNTLTAGQFIITAGRSVAVIGTTSNLILELTPASFSPLNRQGTTIEIATGEYVNLHPNQRLAYYTGGVWGDILDYSDTNSGGNVMEAFRLDNTHIMFIQRIGSATSQIFIQVIRKLSDIFWQHQTTSATDLGFNNIFTAGSFWYNAAENGNNTLVTQGPRFAHFIDSTNLATVYSTGTTTIRFTVVQV